jgi:hypothetical protein
MGGLTKPRTLRQLARKLYRKRKAQKEGRMANASGDQAQASMALAALAAAFAQTLDEQDPTFVQRFEASLDRVYQALGHYPGDTLHAQEMLSWVGALLRDVQS